MQRYKPKSINLELDSPNEKALKQKK